MQDRQKKLAEIFRRFWIARQGTGGGAYQDVTKADCEQLSKAIRSILTDADIVEIFSEIPQDQRDNQLVLIQELLLWIKTREVEFRARLKRRPRPGSPQPDYVVPYDVYSGMVQAYHDVWRQMLFPGKSVEDGTIAPCALAMAELEWTEKAEEVLRIKREGGRGE